ncbi:hypothetical protein DTO013E5_964 [Penicillium roqueforti]|uniref:Genomic scaffold, ProqFM164S01 n=1 Tax=Penicillium roqueforti (strain FM164) TaxID=1365484 RepID=W6PXB0_PENRF|nr:hypothetical protein DTO012A1_339 [Penicillium roqueforti]CDM28590.1 unnamed protein product [Penicillium roqueforti FM164]KAI2751546.1 hypothetical protein DTO013F2_3883 [Penicillium roqueforti]KAI2772690.1 hypothetical protein DTO012A8_2730 [Penicillium roqueforti]KAI3083447.1 hypothetical protein CBS147339_1823 [Penicillium roqueforti]
MTVTTFPSEGSPDLALLNVARLFTRLEHNLLSPGTDRRAFQQSEYQRMRVNKNVEYARLLLTQLERSLPQIKPLDRKHEAQAEIARDRQLLKRIQTVLEEEAAKAEAKQGEEDETDDIDDEWKELFSKPVTEKKTVSRKDQQIPTRPSDSRREVNGASQTTITSSATATPATTTPTPTPSSTSPPAQASAPAPPTLRNRYTTHPAPPSFEKAATTGRDTTKLSGTESELSTHRLEQEDLTSSLLALASQLKASSHNFQATLEGEKSALDRAVSGIDRTSTTMEAAGKRMGMLRKMTEGKGLWGRMMLYAWIFGLWVVAILLVYVGPKLRF